MKSKVLQGPDQDERLLLQDELLATIKADQHQDLKQLLNEEIIVKNPNFLSLPLHNDGKTLLHHAIQRKNFLLTQLLLDHGANLYALDSKRVRACDIATWNEIIHPAIIVPLSEKKFTLGKTKEQLSTKISLLETLSNSCKQRSVMLQNKSNSLHENLIAIKTNHWNSEKEITKLHALCKSVKAEKLEYGPKMQLLQDKMIRLKEKKHDIEMLLLKYKTATLIKLEEREDLLKAYRLQLTRQDELNKAKMEKFEIIQAIELIVKSQELTISTLNSLVAMWNAFQLPEIFRYRMIKWGLQTCLIRLIAAFPNVVDIHVQGCGLLVLLMKEIACGDNIKVASKWDPVKLLALLVDTTQFFHAQQMVEGNDNEEACKKATYDVAIALHTYPEQSSIALEELHTILQESLKKIGINNCRKINRRGPFRN